jgi:hypothetical protein
MVHFLIVLVAYRDLINALRMDGFESFFNFLIFNFILFFLFFNSISGHTYVAANS